MTNKEMFEQSFKRPTNYFKLSPERQWEIDKELGILDWNGSDLTEQEHLRYIFHYSTKTQINKIKNKKFFEYLESNFPEYEINDEEGGGRVILSFNNKSDDAIEYHRGRFEVYCSKYACKKTQDDVETMEDYLKVISL